MRSSVIICILGLLGIMGGRTAPLLGHCFVSYRWRPYAAIWELLRSCEDTSRTFGLRFSMIPGAMAEEPHKGLLNFFETVIGTQFIDVIKYTMPIGEAAAKLIASIFFGITYSVNCPAVFGIESHILTL